MKPRYYQFEKMINPALAKFKDGKSSALIVAPTGAGKTAVAAWWSQQADNKNRRVLVLTHKKTIQGQMLKTFHHFGIKRGAIQSGRPITSENAQIAMISTLINRLNSIPCPDWIIVDECLTGDSKIITDKGYKKIKNIKIGDKVLSSDLKYHNVYNKIKRKYETLFIITLKNGNKIKCTGNHKIMTSSGWKYAKDITSLDMVQSIMYDKNYGNKILLYLREIRNNGKSFKKSKEQIQKIRKILLLKRMHDRIQKKNIFFNNGENKQKIRVRKNEKKQSNVQAGNKKKSKYNFKSIWTQAKNTGRKWKTLTSAASSNIPGAWMGYGSSCKNKNESRFWISNLLQNRCSKQRIENRNRNKWSIPQFARKKKPGCKKRNFFIFVGVENIEIQKSRSNRRFKWLHKQNLVYDLSIEDSHNYFANNVLVHNCHHMRESNMWGKAFRHYERMNPYIKLLGLTATPNGRTDNLGLHPFFDTIVNDLSIKYLVNEGWLVFPHTMIGEKIKVPKFHIGSNGDYDKTEQTEYFSKKKVIGSAVENYHQYMDGMPVIVSCVSLKHAHFIQQQYEKAAKEKRKNWKAVMIQGGSKYESQMFDALEGLSKGSVQIITFVDVLGEGVDVPACSGIQMLRKTKSMVLYRQFIGRTLRPFWPEYFDQHSSTKEQRLAIIRSSMKPIARVQDFAENVKEHRHPLNEPEWTLKDTKIKGKKGSTLKLPDISICPQCSGVWPGIINICPDCGFNLHEEREKSQGRKPPKEIEGILKEVLPDNTDEIDFKNLVNQVIEIQKLPAKEKAMISSLYKNGDNDKTRAMSRALGYHESYTHKVYNRLIKK